MKRTESVQCTNKKFGVLRKESNGMSLHFPVTKTTQANFVVILHVKIEDPAEFVTHNEMLTNPFRISH